MPRFPPKNMVLVGGALACLPRGGTNQTASKRHTPHVCLAEMRKTRRWTGYYGRSYLARAVHFAARKSSVRHDTGTCWPIHKTCNFARTTMEQSRAINSRHKYCQVSFPVPTLSHSLRLCNIHCRTKLQFPPLPKPDPSRSRTPKEKTQSAWLKREEMLYNEDTKSIVIKGCHGWLRVW
jgi:hypothetical protein